MREQLSTAEGRIATIAAPQHGVVTREQLAAVGVDRSGVTRRVQAGRLHRLHRGVYAVGHRGLSWRGRWLAAVLAAGEGAVLSHSSAAALWQFLRPILGPVHVTVAASLRPRSRLGLVVHRSRALPGAGTGHGEGPSGGTRPTIVTRRHGIAVTTAARTIEDIRGEVEPYLFRRALRQAELGGHRVPHLSLVRRTRSDLKLLFLALCEQHRLPRPEVNVRIGPRGDRLPISSAVEGGGHPTLAQQSSCPARTQTRRRGGATSSGRGRRRARRGPARAGGRRPRRGV